MNFINKIKEYIEEYSKLNKFGEVFSIKRKNILESNNRYRLRIIYDSMQSRKLFNVGLVKYLVSKTLGRNNFDIFYDDTQDIQNPFNLERDIVCFTNIISEEKDKLDVMKYNEFPVGYKINLIFDNEVV